MIYDQPFCTIGSKGEFRGASHGYLPPISLPDVNGQASTDGGGGEPRKESNVTDPLSEIQQQLDSIKSENQWLRNRINYLYDKKRKPKKQNNVETLDFSESNPTKIQ